MRPSLSRCIAEAKLPCRIGICRPTDRPVCVAGKTPAGRQQAGRQAGRRRGLSGCTPGKAPILNDLVEFPPKPKRSIAATAYAVYFSRVVDFPFVPVTIAAYLHSFISACRSNLYVDNFICRAHRRGYALIMVPLNTHTSRPLAVPTTRGSCSLWSFLRGIVFRDNADNIQRREVLDRNRPLFPPR